MFCHKVDYKGDTNDNTHGYEYSPNETNDSVRTLEKEHENEEDEVFKEDASVINDKMNLNLVKIKQKKLSKPVC